MLSFPLSPAEATPIKGCLSWANADGKTYYFANLDPIDHHPADDRRALHLRLARLHHKSGVRIVDLVKAFGVPRSTVKRAIQRYAEEGENAFLKPVRRPGAGPRRRVVTPELAQRAKELLASGMSQRACARELGLSPATFHVNLRAGVIEAPVRAAPSTDRPRRDAQDKKPAMGRACHDVERRQLAAAGLLEEAAPRFDRAALAVPRGGVLTALPMLLEEGLLKAVHRWFRLPKGFYGLSTILLLTAFMLLARVRNPETLRHQPPGEWGQLLGLDRCPEVKTLRKKVRLLADSKSSVLAWQRTLSESWLEGEGQDSLTLAVDGHVKVYSGRKGRLPKHFVSREKLCLPASASYWINVLGGKPLVCLHQDLDPKLVKALEHEVVPELERLGVKTADAPDLTREDAEPVATLVFDREGWSPALFRRLARRGVACITWHKNFQGKDWPPKDFHTHKVPVYGPAGCRSTTVSLAEKNINLKNGPRVRQIRRRLDNGRQVPLITTHPCMPIEKVAGAMFSRWSQENFFKYMREEFNLDALPEHALEPLNPDTRVVNPAHRTVRKAIDKLRPRLQKLSHRIRQYRKKRKRIAPLTAEARALERELKTLQQQADQLPSHVRAGDLPDDQKLHTLPVAQRLLVDVVRMICYRAETRMMPAVAAAQGKKSRPRKLLFTLLQADANLVPEPDQGVLRVELLGLGNHAAEQMLRPLLEQLTQTRTRYPGTQLRLVYQIAGSPEPENGSTKARSGQDI